VPETSVAGLFGSAFAQRLAAAEPGQWVGPVASDFGQHLVRVTGRVDGTAPPLSELREVVREEWLGAQAQARRDQAYRALRERYRIVVERPQGLPAAIAAGPEATRP
jgi:parvulin-like peptidyl-prolyl isomerase